jgi:hypothetical protein
MTSRMFLALACALVIVRLPSLVQPMGADQGLYAYVGERILAGGLPYVDAWDQKPPAVHVTYAVLRAIWPHDSVVAAADLVGAMAVAWLLVSLGAVLVRPVTGQVAALIFLFLSNPAFGRLGGVAVRAQAETFIAVIVTGAFLLLLRPGARHGGSRPRACCSASPSPSSTTWRCTVSPASSCSRSRGAGRTPRRLVRWSAWGSAR